MSRLWTLFGNLSNVKVNRKEVTDMNTHAARSYSYLCSTIGQKQLMGISGLVWSGFVLTHMAGNMLILVSAEKYNRYGHAMISNPFLLAAEAVLVLALLLHVIKGVMLTYRNKSSRAQPPAVGLSGEKNSSFAVKTMIYQGVIILVFIVLHLLTFKFGTYYNVNYGDGEIRDLHRLIVEVFQSPIYAFGYMACMIVLALHLSHGFYSSFQTLGFHHPKYSPALKIMGNIYAIIVSLGFLSQPFYVYFIYKG